MSYVDPFGAFGPIRRTCNEHHPYTPSIASTASSSATSIFSAGEGLSSQSSAASSVRSASLSWDGDASCGAALALQAAHRCRPAPATANRNGSSTARAGPTVGPAASVVPLELRLHPRRTHGAGPPDPASQRAAPPPLVRQCDRKDNFVENLVDTTSQMIEVIWPLSVVACGRDGVLGGKNLIGLRTFIQEVLKRSKTSYSTLQVALYYLVLIKPCIPKLDFTHEQSEDSHAARAMQCGRRMFLAALILASKYLQDRNYSARAWSKISGLKVAEINSNEIAFLLAVNWQLHIPEPLFQRWTDVVLKYSLTAAPAPPRSPLSWRAIVARLNATLDNIEPASPASPQSLPPMSPPAMLPRPAPERALPGDPAASRRAKPEALEPHPRAPADAVRFPPISPTITQLPTPQMTPQPHAFGTPAASAAGGCPGRSAMAHAMKHAQHLSMLRCTVDAWPSTEAGPFARRFTPPGRRSSDERSTTSSIMSSPESMVSDASSQSSRSSRASSISSVASAAGALPPPPVRLAVQATRRCASRQMAQGKPAVYASSDLWSNVNPFASAAEESYVRGGRMDENEPPVAYPYGRADDPEATAAFALRELALAGAAPATAPVAQRRKRERPSSGINPRLQDEVAALLQRRETGCGVPDEVAADPLLANSLFLNQYPPPAASIPAGAVATSGSQAGARKRLCGREEAKPSTMSVPPSCGPGMWHPVL